jgi:conjugal transfer pilus assembly protein TrbC
MKFRELYILLLLLPFLQPSYCADYPNASLLQEEQENIDKERKILFSPDNQAINNSKRSFPTKEEIKKEQETIEVSRKQMFAPDNPATKDAPNSFPNIPTPEVSGIDLNEVARRYEQKAFDRKMNDLLVFVSFTMPRESLKRLISQTNRVGGTVLFNGFKNNSLKLTAMAVNELEEERVNIQIAPDAFKQYKINAVPTIVLAKAAAIGMVGKEGCALPDNYTAITGDVSLEYALKEIAKRDPHFRSLATRYASLINGR